MFLVFIISLFYLIFAIYINSNWIHEIAAYFSYPLAIYLVVFVALIPGFIYVFTLLSILFTKKERKDCIKRGCDVTILIPVYNAKESIQKTIDSIMHQRYCGKIHIMIIDDGSTDASLALIKKMYTTLKLQYWK